MERTSQLAEVGWEKHDKMPEEIPDDELQALMNILQAHSDE